MANEPRSAMRCVALPNLAASGESAGKAGVVDWCVTRDQARLKTSVPFVPPNPNEFFSATSIFISRAVFAQ